MARSLTDLAFLQVAPLFHKRYKDARQAGMSQFRIYGRRRDSTDTRASAPEELSELSASVTTLANKASGDQTLLNDLVSQVAALRCQLEAGEKHALVQSKLWARFCLLEALPSKRASSALASDSRKAIEMLVAIEEILEQLPAESPSRHQLKQVRSELMLDLSRADEVR